MANFELTDKQRENGKGFMEMPSTLVTEQDMEAAKRAWKINPPEVQYTNMIDPEIIDNVTS